MPYSKEIKGSVAKKCLFFVLTGSIYFLSDYTALVLAYGWFISTVHSVDYIYTTIKMLTALDAIAHFTEIKFCLKRIEDILRNYYSTVENLPGVTKDVICKRDWVKTVYNMSIRLGSLTTIGSKRINVILNLNRCYLLLLEQCDYINGMFGVRILLGGLVYLMEMVMLTNLIIRLILRTMIPFYQSSVFPIISTAMKIVNYSLILVCGTDCCEQTYKHTMRIARCIDHLLANKKLAIEEHKALQELRDLITTRPVSFNAMNFYTLNYHTMLSVASAVVTYTIILLQNMQ
ncbi:uncharacterized protein LOC120633468 [Pararge aegeria]|uniref:uncharacterized protein LOC120633468 n=1 Tax=Pararge aegeria TaxID=116150 RepID=UPI0019D0BB0E|nr:uncharacterized protein LOC120633468 [Pararge aegeria]